MIAPVHFSSATDEWPTPQKLFDALDAEFGFTLDPCATKANAKCRRYFTKEEDGLRQDWADETVFMNPPYGRAIGRWMAKAYAASRAGATVVCLVPARTDTTWWHRYAMKGQIRLLKGRIRFEGGRHSAPFPSAIVVFRPPGHAIVSASEIQRPHTRFSHAKCAIPRMPHTVSPFGDGRCQRPDLNTNAARLNRVSTKRKQNRP